MSKGLRSFIFDAQNGNFKLNQKLTIFLFCLALSTAFWFLSSLSKNYTTRLSLPLEYASFSKDFLLVDQPIEEIEVEVYGGGYELLGEQVGLNNTSIQINYGGARPSKNKDEFYVLGRSYLELVKKELDKDLKVLGVYPDTIFFKTQVRKSKKVKVIPKLELSYSSGYRQRGPIEIIPNMVEISGPEGVLDSILTLTNETVYFSELQDTLIQTIDLIKPSKQIGLELIQEKVTIKIPVEQYTEKLITLPIHVKNEGVLKIKTFPDEVELVLLVPISKYEMVNETNIRAYVVFEDKISPAQLEIKIEGLPEFYEISRIKPKQVEYIIRKSDA